MAQDEADDTQPRAVDAVTGVVDKWLRRDIGLKATVIHERLVAGHAFTANYQRVKEHVRLARPAIAAELGVGEQPLLGTASPSHFQHD